MSEHYPQPNQPEAAQQMTSAESLGLQDGAFTVVRGDGSSETGWSVVSIEAARMNGQPMLVDGQPVMGATLRNAEGATKRVTVENLMGWQPKPEEDVNRTVPRSERLVRDAVRIGGVVAADERPVFIQPEIDTEAETPEQGVADSDITEKPDGAEVRAREVHNALDGLDRAVMNAENTDDTYVRNIHVQDLAEQAEQTYGHKGIAFALRGAALGASRELPFVTGYMDRVIAPSIDKLLGQDSAAKQTVHGILDRMTRLIGTAQYGNIDPHEFDNERNKLAVLISETADQSDRLTTSPEQAEAIGALLHSAALGLAPRAYKQGHFAAVEQSLKK